MNKQFTPDEYVAELGRQTGEATALVRDLTQESISWQPDGGKSWSVGQCLDHLIRTNQAGLAAMRSAVEENRDQLGARREPMQPAGWFSHWFVGFIGPDPRRKARAPAKIVPPSQVAPDVLAQFATLQNSLADFVTEFKDADLGGIRYKNPLAPILRWTADTGLLIVVVHNQRHLQQAERVKSREDFPQAPVRQA